MKPFEVRQKHYNIRASHEDKFRGELVLVNRQHPVRLPVQADQLRSLDVYPSIHQLDKGMRLDKQCLEQLYALLKACGGMDDILAVSGYRTKEEQTRIYNDSLIERGADYTSQYVAWPGHSEHQTGLAIDVGRLKSKLDFIAPTFPDRGIYRSFREQAANYGFILRYKKEKESITQISHEPWHFRYVGYPHSRIMEEKDLCLEEYIDFVQTYRYSGEQLTLRETNRTTKIYYVPADKGDDTEIPILTNDAYSISGNNRDGFIITTISELPKH